MGNKTWLKSAASALSGIDLAGSGCEGLTNFSHTPKQEKKQTKQTNKTIFG